jgi:hypothetical protein
MGATHQHQALGAAVVVPALAKMVKSAIEITAGESASEFGGGGGSGITSATGYVDGNNGSLHGGGGSGVGKHWQPWYCNNWWIGGKGKSEGVVFNIAFCEVRCCGNQPNRSKHHLNH